MFSFIKKDLTFLLVILLIGFCLRLYKINNPIADWHSWRQADTAAVSRDYYQHGFNLLFPKYDDMSPVSDQNLPNPQHLRFVEFPIYNSLVYFLYVLNGGVDEKLARLVSVFMSLGSTVFLYLIVRREWGKAVGLVSALFFAILPYNIYYSRVVLPEPTLMFFSLGALFFFDLWIKRNSGKLFLLSFVFAACALLLKPTAVFLLLPIIYLVYLHEGKVWPLPTRYWMMAFLIFLPLAAWRIWISHYPQGIPASGWLLNGNGIRFKPAFWRWIIQDRFGREILTVCGTVLFVLGLLFKPRNGESYFLHLLALSSFLYLIVFATGNVQHDYYQILIIPSLVVFLARGFILMFEGIPALLPRIWTIPTAMLLIALTFGLGWYEIRGLYQINNPAIVEAGKEANKILPKEAVVIAPYGGDTAFLYQINRPGFPIIVSTVVQMVKDYGVSSYVSVNKDPKTVWLMQRYKVLKDTPDFVIIDLTVPLASPGSNNSTEPS